MSATGEAKPRKPTITVERYRTGLVIPCNAPADFLTAALYLDKDPLPFKDLTVARLQYAFDHGIAVAVTSTDKPLVNRVLKVLEMLAGVVVPPGAVQQ